MPTLQLVRLKKRSLSLLVCLLLAAPLFAQQADSLNVGVNTAIRALQVVNDSVLWFGGNKGWLGRSSDGGKNWKLWQPAGEQADFRSLQAIDALNAIAATTTRPANIIRTHDGGKTWKRVYQSRDTTVFINGMDFWNENDGVLFGDPIENRLFLMRTTDGGRSWDNFPDEQKPIFAAGEACFAASGTAIRAVGDSTLVIVSGGSVSRLWYSYDRGQSWQNTKTPLQQGLPSMGAFSVAVAPDSHYVVVGGDYTAEDLAVAQIGLLDSGIWWIPRTSTRGYRESVAVIDTFFWLATGPSGSDITFNGGLDWQALNDVKGMHTVQKARSGQSVFMAGNRGVILVYPKISPPLLPQWRATTKLGKSMQAGDLKPFEKKLKRIVRKRGKPKKPGYENDFLLAAEKVATEIKRLEGVDSIYVTRPSETHYFIDGIQVKRPVILHMRLRVGSFGGQYCLELDEGRHRRNGIKQLGYRTNKRASPRFYRCRDFERRQRIKGIQER